jgi:hypothetical protein
LAAASGKILKFHPREGRLDSHFTQPIRTTAAASVASAGVTPIAINA